MCFVYFLIWSKLFLLVDLFNIDTLHPVIIVNPDRLQNKTYFGYSVGLYSENDGEWVAIIGAPATIKGGIPNVGALYKCPFLKNCTEISHKTITGYPNKLSRNSWIGGSIDVNNKFRRICVSSFRWHQQVELPDLPKPIIIMTGGLFLTDLNKTSTSSISPLKNELHTIGTQFFYYGEAAVGFSVHFTENTDELLLGAPGINNFLGSVLKIDNFSTKLHQVVEPTGDYYYEFGGYSVTSGYFYNRNDLLYASGAPRGTYGNGNIINGLVVLFSIGYDFNAYGELRPITKAIISGTQVGEYFGAVLGAGDLNSDGLTDLIIGAPFRKNNPNGYNQGSVYIYYGAKKRLKHNKQNDRIDGSLDAGLFGSAIMYLGDINRDGYGELAISAPYEDVSGAIYIYSYRRYELVLIQKILGKEISPELRGFGISFSRPGDIDKNGFLDLAVGSYASGHVVLLRSQPVVTVIARLKTSEIHRNSNKSSFQICYFYSDYNAATLEITQEIVLDKILGRALVLEKKGKLNITILYKKEKCERIKFAINKNKINWKEPITIAVSYQLPVESQRKHHQSQVYISPDRNLEKDTFCTYCPVLDENRSSKKIILGYMPWSQFCGSNNRTCRSTIYVSGKFDNLGDNTFILGSSDFVTLNVKVKNYGDPLYGTLLEIILPPSVGLRQKPGNCQIEFNTRVVCEIGDNGDEMLEAFVQDFELNMKTINDGTEKKQLSLSIKAFSATANQPQDIKNMTIKLTKEADFILTGQSVQQSYVQEVETNSPVKIENIFKVEKFGVSPVSQVQIQIIIPYYIKTTKTLERFTKLVNYRGVLGDEAIICTNNFEDKNTDGTGIHMLSTKDGESTDINISEDIVIGDNSTFHLSCADENFVCATINCTAGPFKHENSLAEFSVQTELNIKYIEGFLKDKNFILFISSAKLLVDNLEKEVMRKEMTTIANLIVLHKSRKIAMWILILSAILGFILLMLFSFCLYKAGFFKRANHMKLELLKEQLFDCQEDQDEILVTDHQPVLDVLEFEDPYQEDNPEYNKIIN